MYQRQELHGQTEQGIFWRVRLCAGRPGKEVRVPACVSTKTIVLTCVLARGVRDEVKFLGIKRFWRAGSHSREHAGTETSTHPSRYVMKLTAYVHARRRRGDEHHPLILEETTALYHFSWQSETPPCLGFPFGMARTLFGNCRGRVTKTQVRWGTGFARFDLHYVA